MVILVQITNLDEKNSVKLKKSFKGHYGPQYETCVRQLEMGLNGFYLSH